MPFNLHTFSLKKIRAKINAHLLFRISIILKGLNALIEIIGGFITLFITKILLIQVVFLLTQDELGEDPKDFIATHLVTAAQQFSLSTQHFAALYLLVHGFVKGFLVIALLKNKLWAYPASMIIFSLFILYQLTIFASTHSLWLIVLTLFDILVLWLIWHEYRYIKNKKHAYTSNE